MDIDSTLSTSESLTDAEIFKTSDFLSEPETDSADEAIHEEEIAVVKPLILGALAENYIHELRRYVQQQSGVSDNIFSALNILGSFIENTSNTKQKQTKMSDFLLSWKIMYTYPNDEH